MHCGSSLLPTDSTALHVGVPLDWNSGSLRNLFPMIPMGYLF